MVDRNDAYSAQQHQFQTAFELDMTSSTIQYFGSNDSGKSPVIPDFSFTDELDDAYNDDGALGSGLEHKRRRIARACDMCRKRKIKCDGAMPACRNCITHKIECVFTHVEKKRNPPKGAKYIEALENRLARMENLLRTSGVLKDDEGTKFDLAAIQERFASHSHTEALTRPHSSDAHRSGSISDERTPDSSKAPILSVTSPSNADGQEDSEVDIEELSDLMCSLVTNGRGETRYIGSSSGFSIFSPKGIQWVNEKTGDTSFSDMMNSFSMHDVKWAYWRPEVFGDVFERRTYQPLPSRNETASLLRDFFDNFNCMFPLFHEPTFMHLVDRHYSREPFEGSGWWASLNIALAIAYRIRVMSNVVPQEEDRKSWGFLKNSMGVLTELTVRNSDLLSVQALLGMALFLLGTPNPQPTHFLVAAAIRAAQGIGLHKRGSSFNLSPVEMEQRKRVFWIAYLIDKNLSLRAGRPPAQVDDDMNVEMPTENPSDNIGNIPLSDGKAKVNLFKLMVQFAIIESKVYTQLYSTKATRQSAGELLNAISNLDTELEAWKAQIPLELRPEHVMKASHAPLILHLVVMHFAYYNCLATIHRMCVHHGYWTSRLSSFAIQGLNARPLNPRVFSSAILCVQAARDSIELLRYIPQGDYSCVWLIIYYPVTALVTLFASILQNPQDSRARGDIKLMEQVVNFLSLLSVTEEQGGVRGMLKFCLEFTRIAKVVIQKFDTSTRQRRTSSYSPSKADSATDMPLQTPYQQQQQQSQIQFGQTVVLGPNNAAGPPNFFVPAIPISPVDPCSQIIREKHEIEPHASTASFDPPSPESTIIPTATPSIFDFSSAQQSHIGTTSSDLPTFAATLETREPDAESMRIFGAETTEQPFLIPQELWNLPVAMGWDWSDWNIQGNGNAGASGTDPI